MLQLVGRGKRCAAPARYREHHRRARFSGRCTSRGTRLFSAVPCASVASHFEFRVSAPTVMALLVVLILAFLARSISGTNQNNLVLDLTGLDATNQLFSR
jgi:hypothetical protein